MKYIIDEVKRLCKEISKISEYRVNVEDQEGEDDYEENICANAHAEGKGEAVEQVLDKIKKLEEIHEDDTYTLVLFPEVQDYMEKDWFESEAILYQTINEEQEYLSSAYFIPSKYV
jgi:hypothetical protein